MAGSNRFLIWVFVLFFIAIIKLVTKLPQAKAYPFPAVLVFALVLAGVVAFALTKLAERLINLGKNEYEKTSVSFKGHLLPELVGRIILGLVIVGFLIAVFMLPFPFNVYLIATVVLLILLWWTRSHMKTD